MAAGRQGAAARRYTLHFDAPARGPANSNDAHPLTTGTLADAKLQASLLHACSDTPLDPQGYRIVGGASRVVYRYPERPAA
jgi:hypothetical protein